MNLAEQIIGDLDEQFWWGGMGESLVGMALQEMRRESRIKHFLRS